MHRPACLKHKLRRNRALEDNDIAAQHIEGGTDEIGRREVNVLNQG